MEMIRDLLLNLWSIMITTLLIFCILSGSLYFNNYGFMFLYFLCTMLIQYYANSVWNTVSSILVQFSFLAKYFWGSLCELVFFLL